jgi:hypothetical protein
MPRLKIPRKSVRLLTADLILDLRLAIVLRGLRLFKAADFRGKVYAFLLVLRNIPFFVPFRAFLLPAAIRLRNAVFAAPFSLAIKIQILLSH